MIGEVISHYKIIEKVGEGGMGVVYKAEDTKLNRTIALKFIPSHLTKDESTKKRFVVEAQAASTLDHPNICAIHEINETADGRLYICMAFYQGESLRDRIISGAIALEDALDIFLQLARGLAAAHEKNIIHRDIKPGNIIITEKGEVKIVDFGLAKLAGIDLTKSTSSQGTAAYMCPEQIRGEKVDHRCDIWAMGVVFYEMLTGNLPFEGDYPEPLMYAIVNEKPRPLSLHLSGFPELLQKIIDKVLNKDPAERYQSISELLTDLQPLVKEIKIVIIKQKPAFMRLLGRKKAQVFLSFIVIFVIILLMIFGKSYFYPDQKTRLGLAVLPFRTITKDSSQEMLASGMADLLRGNLTELGDVNVINSASSMAYKDTGKNPAEIASELNVQYLVEAVYIPMGDTISLSVRLNNVNDDDYLWAKEYKAEFKKILGLRGEITKAIASKIGIILPPKVEMRLTETRQVNQESFELYIKGMVEINRGTHIGLSKGMDYLKQAVQIDSTEPLALAGLSMGYSIIAHGSESAPDTVRLSKNSAAKALALDENLAEAHMAQAMIKIYKEWDVAGAGESYRKALAIKPNYSLALIHYGYWLLLMEGAEKAMPLIQQAMELEPKSHIYPTELAEVNFINISGNNDLIIELSKRALELEPDFPKALYTMGAGYANQGMYDHAIELQKKAAQLNPAYEYTLAYTYAQAGMTDKAMEIAEKLEQRNDTWDTWCLAVIYSALGNEEKIFYWLEQAIDRRHPFIQWLPRMKRFFSQYHNDPRFRNMFNKLNSPVELF